MTSLVSLNPTFLAIFYHILEVAPPLPERNYYDEDLAGEYTELRIDARPPNKSRIPPSKSMQNEQKESESVNRSSDLHDLYVSMECVYIIAFLNHLDCKSQYESTHM